MKSCMDLRVRARVTVVSLAAVFSIVTQRSTILKTAARETRVTGPNLYNDTQESANETLRCGDNTDL